MSDVKNPVFQSLCPGFLRISAALWTQEVLRQVLTTYNSFGTRLFLLWLVPRTGLRPPILYMPWAGPLEPRMGLFWPTRFSRGRR